MIFTRDHAVSGATLLRPGFQAMMQSALRKDVDVVLGPAITGATA
jgi:hypothetical protein